MTETPETHAREADRLIYAGLLGLSVAALLQLLDQAALDTPLSTGVYCFAGAVPFLAVGLITDYARRAGTEIPTWRDVVGILGALTAVTGLGALLLHFGVGVCVVFASGCVIGFILIRGL
jgi:hypothetical protein